MVDEKRLLFQVTPPHYEDALKKYFNHYLYRLKAGFVMVITGGSFMKGGTGKSYGAMRLARIIDPDFPIENVTFTPREFLEAMKRVEKSGKPGQVVVLDEGEISASSRAWFTITNRAISDTLATFRVLRCVVIVITPSLAWIDSRVRTLMLLRGYTILSIEDNDIVSHLYLREVHTDLQGEKIFYPYLRFWDKVNKRVVFGAKWRIQKPPQDLIDAYEEKSRAFKTKVRDDLFLDVERFERVQKGELAKTDHRSIANELLLNPTIREEIALKGKVSQSVVKAVRPSLSFYSASTVAKLINLGLRKKLHGPATATT